MSDVTTCQHRGVAPKSSDCLLQLAAFGQIDLNNLARLEFRARRRHEAAQRIAVMAGGAP